MVAILDVQIIILKCKQDYQSENGLDNFNEDQIILASVQYCRPFTSDCKEVSWWTSWISKLANFRN